MLLFAAEVSQKLAVKRGEGGIDSTERFEAMDGDGNVDDATVFRAAFAFDEARFFETVDETGDAGDGGDGA